MTSHSSGGYHTFLLLSGIVEEAARANLARWIAVHAARVAASGIRAPR